MATHVSVVPKSEWKPVFIEPHLLQQSHMASLIGIQELTDYTFGTDSVEKGRNLKKKKQRDKSTDEKPTGASASKGTVTKKKIKAAKSRRAVSQKNSSPSDSLSEPNVTMSDSSSLSHAGDALTGSEKMNESPCNPLKKKRKKKKKKVCETAALPENTGELQDDSKLVKTKKKKLKKRKVSSGGDSVMVVDHTDKLKEHASPSKSQKSAKPKRSKKAKGQTVAGPVVDVAGMELDDSSVQAETKENDKKRKNSGSAGEGPPRKKKKRKAKRKKRNGAPSDADDADVAGDADVADEDEKPLPDMSAWKDLYVPGEVLQALAEQGFISPMPIQALALPSAIRDKKDIIGAAETGSGKTLAFGIPLIHHILQLKSGVVPHSTDGDDAHSDESDSERGEQEMDEDAEEEDAGGDAELDDAEMSDEDLGDDDDADDDGGDAAEDDDDDVEDDSDDDNEEEEEEDGDSNEDAADGSHGDELPLGLAVMPEDEEDLEDGSDYDLPPGNEQIPEIEDNEVGCVFVETDVTFDWLDKPPVKSRKSVRQSGPLYALVLTPTRELAIQVKDHLLAAAKHTSLQVACIVGGLASQKQERLLRKSPEIVVATPGRLWELIQEGEPHLSQVEDVKFLVIDEADRMVEKGHFQELTQLLEMINADQKKKNARQTFVFSATLTLIHSGPNRFLKKKRKKITTSDEKIGNLMGLVGIKEKPKVIDLSGQVGMAKSLTEARIVCSVEEKDVYLYYLLHQYAGRTLVFCNTKDCVRRLISVLSLLQCNPLPLHADMHQRQRLKNLDRFKSNSKGLLLATDVAARGLDIPRVEHVIHYQVPKTSENYVHRSGRTARAYSEGLSVMLISPEEMKDYRRILHTLSRDEDLPMFPFEQDYLPGIKARVSLTHQIDKEEHKVTKQQMQNNWFQRAAKEMDIELDEELLLHEMGNDQEQADHRRKIQGLKLQLKSLIGSPIIPARFSGKYPTKSGFLELPFMRLPTSGGAVTAVKNDAKIKLPAPRIPRP